MARLLRFLLRLQSQLWLWLLGLSLTTIVGIGALVRGVRYDILLVITLGSLVMGWLLARLRVPGRLALPVFIGAGLEIVLLVVGRLFPQLLAVILAGLRYLGAISSWEPGYSLPDAGPLWTALYNLGQGGEVVLTRWLGWFTSLGEAGVYDPLAVQLVWGWALWLAAALAAYLIWQEQQALLAVAPLGALLAAAIFFTGSERHLLPIFLFLALALQAGAGWRRRERRWQLTSLSYADLLAQDLTFVLIPLISLIVALSLITPQLSFSRMAARLQRLLFEDEAQVENVVSSLGLEVRAALAQPIIPGGLPRSHLLGSGPELSREVVMLIKTDDSIPISPLEFGGDPPPAYYWLAATFDVYTGHGWASSPTATADLAANEPQLPPAEASREITQTVRRLQTYGNLLFATGFPAAVDQPTQIALRSNQDWAGTILEGDAYSARSWLSQATPDQLQAAGTNYPDWIAKRYLALPEDLPTRVSDLALELTATASTPYDRALALETYLRAIPYSLDVPKPPSGRDVADFFLFELQAGYCDYYATSMTALARAAGLPARFVIGYAPSPYDYETGHYVVRESEAHSWTQIYFPGYGWIDFEPTGGRAPIDRSGEEVAALPTLPPDFDSKAVAAKWTGLPAANVPAWQALGLGLFGLAALAALSLWADTRRLARLPVERLVPVLEGRLERCAQFLGLPLSSGLTPLEFQQRLQNYLARLAKVQPGLQKFAPSAADISRLVSAFVYVRYAPRPGRAVDGQACLAAWRRLRWRLLGAIIVKKVANIYFRRSSTS